MALIFFRTAIVYLLLSFAMRLMGKRAIGELDVGELVVTLLISEICSIPIDDPSIPLLNALIPALFIVSLEIIVSTLKNKNSRLKRFIDGEAVYLIRNGKVNQKAFNENRISIEEFLAGARQAGAATVAEIDYCILEASGKISVIKKNETPFAHVIISDGEADINALSKLGYSEMWLKSKLDGIDASEIFFFSVDGEGNTVIIPKEKK